MEGVSCEEGVLCSPGPTGNFFTIFPNLGTYAPPIMITKVVTNNGETILENEAELVEVMRPEAAFVITNIMQGIINSPINKYKTRSIDQPLAGKTGTSNQMRNAWFVGFSPSLVAGVYVGFDDNKSIGKKEYGIRSAMPIWISFMKKALKQDPEIPKDEFIEPEGIVWKIIDKKTGLLTKKQENLAKKYDTLSSFLLEKENFK